MLKGIPGILSPELLKVLCEMGHSDRLVIADGNFPAESMGKNAKVIRMDGHGAVEILDAILQVFPLDTYVEKPVNLMDVMPGDDVETPIWDGNDCKLSIVGTYRPAPVPLNSFLMDNSTLWHNLRNSYIHNNPLCEECMKDGVVTPATQVHHIKPFMSGLSEDERWQLLTDINNLMAVCDLCHHKLHRNLNKKY